jgi:hypothetical protein
MLKPSVADSGALTDFISAGEADLVPTGMFVILIFFLVTQASSLLILLPYHIGICMPETWRGGSTHTLERSRSMLRSMANHDQLTPMWFETTRQTPVVPTKQRWKRPIYLRS